MNRCLLIFAVALILGRSAIAQELVGAKEALRIFRDKARQKIEQEGDNQVDTSPFGRDLAAYQKELPNLNVGDAATRWVALYEAWRTSLVEHQEAMYSEGESKWTRLLNALPGPDGWPALNEKIRARPIPQELTEQIATYAVRLLTSRLNGNYAEMRDDLVALEKAVGKPASPAGDSPDGNGSVFAKMLNGLLGDGIRSGQYVNLSPAITGLRTAIAADDPVNRFVAELESGDRVWMAMLTVPDLVGLAGRERAAELLLRALTTPNVQLSFNGRQEATLQLARELAAANVDTLATPPWDLCLSTEAGELFERLVKRFTIGEAKQDEGGIGLGDDYYGYTRAASYYLFGLILRGDDHAAMELFVDQMGRNEHDDGRADLFSALGELRPTQEQRLRIYRFLHSLAEAHPELNVWDNLIATGALAGRSREVRQLIDQIVSQDGLDDEARRRLELVRAGVLLAAGDVEDAIGQYRKMLADIGEPKTPRDINTAGMISAKMINVGRLLNRAEWVNEAVATADRLYSLPVENQPSGMVPMMNASTVDVFDVYRNELVRGGRLGRVERLLIDMAAAGQDRSDYYFDGRIPPGVQLAELYLLSKRYEDVVTLLEEAIWWQQDDLSTAITHDWLPTSSHHKSLAFIAARAFAETGNRDLASEITKRLVIANPGSDAAWALLLELAGDEFPGVAERVFRRDQFEERALIWLARYLLDSGRIPEAEETIRRAIAVDPSDGEQGKGDRMRAYAVLADVLAKKGDDQAELFRRAVRAIRMAEDADDFIAAGMFSRGIALYNASLEMFADAYCIQSRLAVELASHGEFERAATHYQRAFELMPDSFGRVESHCFGCEGVFHGELASTIAERVFRRLAQERPNDSKVHYLVGYLRQSEGRPEEALESFRQATTIDPDYLNAWNKIMELQSEVAVPIELADDAALNIFRLAPLRNRYGSATHEVRDLARLWNVAAEVAQRIPKVESGPLYRLKGAADARAARQGSGFEGTDIYWDSDQSINAPTPNEVISANPSVTYISRIMEAATP